MNSTVVVARTSRTPLLLGAGVIAGPLYVLVGVLQVIIRPGFDPTRDDLSLLSNGNLGWIQIGNFLVSGALVIAAAIGVRDSLSQSRRSALAAFLLGCYGAGLIGAGVFAADPMNGFPLGTPDGPPSHPTVHGLLHIMTGAVGFLGLIAACFVMASYFARMQQRRWAVFSRITGIVFFLAFLGIAAGSQQKGIGLQVVTIGFTVAVLLAWSWIAGVSYHFRSGIS